MSSLSTFRYPFPSSMLVLRKPMTDFISEYWALNRSAVNPDTDKVVEGLKRLIPEGTVIEARSGEECLTWLIPYRWQVRHGYLKRRNGKVIASFAQTPLILWKHCIGFQGEVDKDELMQHIITDPNRPDEILFHYVNGFRNGVRDWGFSLSYNTVRNLTDDSYIVDIDADLDNEGTLKVFNAFLAGEYPDTIFFMVHTCHPGQVSDGIANVAVLIQLYNHLKAKSRRKYSYRFIFTPEFFGAAAYLAKAPKEEIANLKFGLYCDMLSNHEPIGFQKSFQGDTKFDFLFDNVVTSHAGSHLPTMGYRQMWGNDEPLYTGPGFEIPTGSLIRGMSREYHFDSDNMDALDDYHLVESLWILQRAVEMLEIDFVPVRNFKGPIYQSRYGLYIDPTKNRRGADVLESIQILMDGERSLMDIAREVGVDFFFVYDIVRQMEGQGLVGISHSEGTQAIVK